MTAWQCGGQGFESPQLHLARTMLHRIERIEAALPELDAANAQSRRRPHVSSLPDLCPRSGGRTVAVRLFGGLSDRRAPQRRP